jgi:hypothetical protein
MKRVPHPTDARDVIRRISELRDLCRRLSRAGYKAGLHPHDPDQVSPVKQVRETPRKYRARQTQAAAK